MNIQELMLLDPNCFDKIVLYAFSCKDRKEHRVYVMLQDSALHIMSSASWDCLLITQVPYSTNSSIKVNFSLRYIIFYIIHF